MSVVNKSIDNTMDNTMDNIVVPFFYYDSFDFTIPNYTNDDWCVIKNYLLFCSIITHFGVLFNLRHQTTVLYKCLLIYNICYRYIFSYDPYTSVKNILTAIFIFDSFEILFLKSKKKFTDAVILYHHISILCIYVFEPETEFTHAIVYGELGNIPMNIHYSLIKYKPSSEIIIDLRKELMDLFSHINIGTYIVIRVLFYTYFMMFIDIYSLSTYYTFIPLYVMGLIWSKKIWKQWKDEHLNNILKYFYPTLTNNHID